MKFLIITNHSYMLWQFRRELIEKLLTRGEVVLSMPFVGHEADFSAMGCRCVETNIDRRSINPVKDLKLYHTYRALLKKERPDTVITYSIKPNIYAGYACRRLHIPHCANVQGLGTAFQKKGIARLVTVMYQIALKQAKTVFFENEGNAAEFVKRGIISADRKTVLHGAGVNLELYEQQDYPSEENGIRFLFLGRIMKEKGIDEFLVSAQKLKRMYGEKVKFDLVGFFEDEYKAAVEKLASSGVINFYGFQTDPKPFYRMCHCVVLPSYHEGMSNVLLEAAATGRALIATDIPGCREAVENGVSGHLCERQNADSLFDAMNRFVRLSLDERRRMGLAGRRHMEAIFDRQRVVAQTLAKL